MIRSIKAENVGYVFWVRIFVNEFFVIFCIVIVYGHLICCPGLGVYSGLGYITMGGLVLWPTFVSFDPIFCRVES